MTKRVRTLSFSAFFLCLITALAVGIAGCTGPASVARVPPTEARPTPSQTTVNQQPIRTATTTAEPVVVIPTASLGVQATPASEATIVPEPTSTATAEPAVAAPRDVLYVPILMYHSFDNANDIYSIRPENFQAQLAAFKEAGFQPVTMKQIVAALDDGAPLPDHPIAITIDDARATQKTAIAMLRKEGFTATFFVPSGWHELSKDDIVQLDQEGFDVESHTVWHANLARSPDKLSEIRDGQLTLEQWLGHPVLGFAYPYGAYRPFDVAELKKEGFAYALSIRNGVALRRSERYKWPRYLVTNESPAHLLSRLNNALKDAEAGKEPPAPSQFG